jgi:hypothetical protein
MFSAVQKSAPIGGIANEALWRDREFAEEAMKLGYFVCMPHEAQMMWPDLVIRAFQQWRAGRSVGQTDFSGRVAP